jgi:NTP pyrophosphatase (non-canonical NTP hydrolase)
MTCAPGCTCIRSQFESVEAPYSETVVRLVWIGDGSEGAVSAETRAFLASELPLVRGIAQDPAYELAGLLFQAAPATGDYVLVFPGDGPGPALPLYQLVEVTDRLLAPGGCPWDRAQTHESLKKYLLEEAYEVLEAIDSGSDEKLKEELGDLILQPVMHAQMKKIAGGFDIDESQMRSFSSSFGVIPTSSAISPPRMRTPSSRTGIG